MVLNTRELLPEPETPVNTVRRRFGISMLTSLRLFSRAPCTRIRSWLSAACGAGDCESVLLAVVIVSPSVGPGAGAGRRWSAGRRYAAGWWCSAVPEQPADVAVGVGAGGYQAVAARVVRRLRHGGTGGPGSLRG